MAGRKRRDFRVAPEAIERAAYKLLEKTEWLGPSATHEDYEPSADTVDLVFPLLASIAELANMYTAGDQAQRHRAEEVLTRLHDSISVLSAPGRVDFLLVIGEHAKRVHATREEAYQSIVAALVGRAKEIDDRFAALDHVLVTKQLQRLRPDRPATGPKSVTLSRVAGVLSCSVGAFDDRTEEQAVSAFNKQEAIVRRRMATLHGDVSSTAPRSDDDIEW